jgi:aminoglycoside/choline kinase family phosphotransferase
MPVSVEAIEKGGSGRKFWRMNVEGQTLILVRYTEERPENRYYVSIGQFLAGVGVCVPRVFFHDEKEGVILMEDAGGNDLWSHRGASWPERRALYQRTLDQALILHTRAHTAANCPHLQQEFNAALYKWEQDYFLEHCLGRHFGLSTEAIAANVDRARLAEIAEHLATQPRCLVHRDFQSQNIIIRNGEVCLIDFQGLRPGLAQYDLASILLDPYVDLTSAERDELLAHYLSGLHGAGQTGRADFLEIYDLCAMQRLMQALGAYGKLGHTDGRKHFLHYVPVAIGRLQEVVERIPRMQALSALLAKLPR